MKRLFLNIAAMAMLPVLPSCTKEVGRTAAAGYPAEVSAIVTANCAVSGCHNTASAPTAGGLDLSSWDALFRGSGSGSAVIPYKSAYSSMFHFTNTYPELGPMSSPTMPLNGTPLPKEQVQTLKRWIDSGAPDEGGRVAGAGAKRHAYIVNQGCDVVTVMDADAKLPIRFIDVGNKPGLETPHQLRVSPDGQYWYVIFINNNVMQKFRCSDNQLVGQIPLSPLAAGTGTEDASDWNTFVISRDGRRAYCVSWTQNGKVCAVDLERMTLLHYIGGQHYPHGITLSPDESSFYVGAQTGNFITEFDTAFTTSTAYPLENSLNTASSLDLHDLLLSADGTEIWITCQKTNDVRVMNVATKHVTGVVTTGVFPQEIVYSQKHHSYFVSCLSDPSGGGSGTITRIDAQTHAAANVSCGFQPHGIAVDAESDLLYVASRNLSVTGPLPHHTSVCGGRNGFLNLIDLATFTVFNREYELSVDPYFIFVK